MLLSSSYFVSKAQVGYLLKDWTPLSFVCLLYVEWGIEAANNPVVFNSLTVWEHQA